MPNTIIITYFVHGTTTDNEKGIATGWNQSELSDTGRQQSIQLRELIKAQIEDKDFDVVICSDLKRAVDSAKLVFQEDVPLIQDKRLRECNYGDLNGTDEREVEEYDALNKPFPNGESYKDVEKRIRSFLKDLLDKYPGKHVAIVAHKVPQLALEVLLNKKTWQKAIEKDWRKKEPKEWRPGWVYILKEGTI